MTRIAHLSDLHLLEAGHTERRGLPRRRLAYLSFGRPMDPERRRRRAALALRRARHADHVVITGDLTEDGVDAQFEVLGEVLAESGLDPARVTLVPGNHDAYADGGAFARALEGPLRAFAATSVPGVPVFLPGVAILPLSTAFEQTYLFSAGSIEDHAIEAADRVAEQCRLAGRALVIAMHHPPVRLLPVIEWIDGLRRAAEVRRLLEQHDHAHVLHGHIHAATERPVRPGAAPRIFSIEAVVDSRGASIRYYRARHGRLAPEAVSALEQLSLAPA
jgi:3',5'-cyclic-AMP phosphodiesterase